MTDADPIQRQRDARLACDDLDALLDAAGRHFTSDKLTPYTRPLTDKEVAALVEDDWQALDESAAAGLPVGENP